MVSPSFIAPAFFLFCIAASIAPAQGQAPPAPIDPVAIARELKEGDLQSESWSAALRSYAVPDGRQAVLDAIKARAEFPKAALVARLRHPELAIRLAALEILEGAAGKDFSYNPWSTDPDDPVNQAAIEAWQAWAAGDEAAAVATAALDDESMGTYLRDIMAGQRDRAERALRMLEPHGSEATGRIQRFLLDNPNLSDAARAHLRSAQYRIVLRPAAGTEAAAVAQRLAFGTRDQQISGLGQLRQFGLASMPIAMNFLDADDPLIRESALDTLLLMGGEGIFPSLKPMLDKESEPNVIHAAIRRFADIKAPGTEELLAKWLGLTEENLVVECLETIAKRSGESYEGLEPDEPRGGILSGIFGGGRKEKEKPKMSPLQAGVVARLSDPAWRVRAAAFQAMAKLRIGGQDEAILKGMDDSDEFVQLAAIEAAAALSMRDAIPKMEAIFLAHPERMAVIASGMVSMRQAFTPKMNDALAKAPNDSVVGVLAAFRARGVTRGDTIDSLTTHPDPDVRAAAFGAIASGFGEVANDAVRDHLVHQLLKGEALHARSIVENITLPRSTEDIASALASRIAETPAGPTTLDPLYDAFLEPLGQGKKDTGAPVSRAPPGALQAALYDIARGQRADLEEDTRFRAALALLRSGHAGSADLLGEGLTGRPASQRAAIAETLSYTSEAVALPILSQLMLDPAERVRQEAVGAALGNAERTKLAILPLRLLGTEGSSLEPWDVYGYSIESLAAEGRARGEVAAWCKEILARADAPAPIRVLAATLAPKAGVPPADLESNLNDPSAHVRRAVAHAWLRGARDRITTALRLSEDPSPFVREAVPAGLVPVSGQWNVRFNDLRSKFESPGYRYTEKARPLPLRPAEEELLRKMLARDPAPSVRFEAAFALLAASKPIDIPAFLRLITEHPDQESTRQRIGNFLQSEYEKLGKPFAALLLYADTSEFRPGTMERMKAHFGLNAASLASFTSIGPARDAGSEPAFLEPAKEPAPAHHPVTLVYFFSPGCAECDKVSRLLENLQNGPVSVQIQKHNIKTSEGGLLNQALCLRLGVPSAQQGVSPSIFTPAGALVTTAITPQALDELLARASATPTPPEWAAISAEERGQAGAALGEKFQQLTLLVVLGGGLLDGINPCAFATIIFFLSYLHVAKRTPRQILGVGIAFISAIFITYFLAGLVLFQFLSWLDQLAWARKALNGFFALFALGVGLFSLRDAWLARQGRLQDMTLQLPGFLKDRIRSTIRGGARQSRYVLAAFTTGIVISLLELACTGQVYAPIIHAVQQGADNAITWLLIYNLAFISPLVIIFLLAFAGMKTNALIQFQQKHTALVKLLLGLLFIGLFLLLAFGSHLLPGAKP